MKIIERIRENKAAKIVIIISAVLIIAGIALTLFGTVGKGGAAFSPSFDAFALTDTDIGKNVGGEVICEVMPAWETEKGQFYILFVYRNEEDDDLILMGFDVPKTSRQEFDYINESAESSIRELTFGGTVCAADDELRERIRTEVSDYYNRLYDIMEEKGESVDFREETMRLIAEKLSSYYIDVDPGADTGAFIGVGTVLITVGAVMLLTALLGKIFLFIFVGIAAVLIAAFFIVFGGKAASIASIKQVSDGLYSMRVMYGYNCDDFLDADRNTIDGMIEWIEDNMFFGARIDYDPGNFGCAAFTAATPDGRRLFGRNFDYPDTDTLVVFTDPKDGYASYSNVDLRFFDIGTNRRLSADSLEAKVMMLAAPYIAMDGINEAGVGVAQLQLDTSEVHQDSGKPDMLVSVAMRGILDKCASVDEALGLIAKYDIHTYLGRSYHLFITDKTGRSVVVEFNDDKTIVIEETGVTNDVLSPENEFYKTGWNCPRYDTIKKTLAEKNNVLTDEEAVELTSAASKGNTQWSGVYDLNSFTLAECIDRDYANVYRFDRKYFS